MDIGMYVQPYVSLGLMFSILFCFNILLEYFFQLGWKKNLDVNLYGMSYGVYLAVDRMGRSKGGKGGRIVNISSAAGLSVYF